MLLMTFWQNAIEAKMQQMVPFLRKVFNKVVKKGSLCQKVVKIPLILRRQ